MSASATTIVSVIPAPIILEGARVRLEPLKLAHLEALCAVGLDPSIWKVSPATIADANDMKQYVGSALAEQASGIAIPFVTREKRTNEIIGSTRFGNIDVPNRKVEIGWTWLSPRWQRTYVNTEAKLLMLTHAFETWKCIRVEFKTDALNEKSRNAILRLGARQEGIHRNHMITESGRFRDSVFFSIIEDEWTTVKQNLNQKLDR